MTDSPPAFDVVIMGGGPAGATLGALLAKSGLGVAIVEREFFPREHIGESFSHRIVPILEESGALEKVLASDCWVKKYGGYYWWDETPATTFFEHHAYEADGVHRWAMHADRPAFDKILLDHARSLGVHVLEGVPVVRADVAAEHTDVLLGDGSSLRCRIFVEASGRAGRTALGLPKREFQSRYRNVAVWNHFVGCKSAQTLPGDWNIFRPGDLSPIANFAFEHGWVWFIPVPKQVLGRRHLTHSIGIVTDARVMGDDAQRYTKLEIFMRALAEIPGCRDLIENAVPVGPTMQTATNYSMISERFSNYDERWILMGDSAYFVDPLFSSGVAFAANHAATAALLIRHRLLGSDSEQAKRDLWADYDEEWHQVSGSFSLAIDQWYHAIASKNPDSVYWRTRAESRLVDVRHAVFQFLVDTGTDLLRFIADGADTVKSDFFHVLTRGSDRVADIGADGPLLDVLSQLAPTTLTGDEILTLAQDVDVRPSAGLTTGKVKATVPAGVPVPSTYSTYWQDPIKNRGLVEPLFAEPEPCFRFVKRDGHATGVKLGKADDPKAELVQMLRQGVRYSEIEPRINAGQKRALRKLAHLGMLRRARPSSGT